MTCEETAGHNPGDDNAGPPESARRVDFLIAAAGGRGFAIALLLGPTVIGPLFGLLFFLLGLDAVAFPNAVRDPTCLLLLRNLALFCIFLGPAVAAALLVLRWPKTVRAYGHGLPTIERPYWIVAALGGLAILIAGPNFYLFGPLSQAACRVAEGETVGDMLAVAAIVVLLSPLATTASVTATYSLLRYERGQDATRPLPANLPVGDERTHMKRTGLALIALSLILFGYIVGSMQGRNTVLIGAEVLIVSIGVLLVRGNLAAARLGAWCIAFATPTLIAGMVLPPLLQPLGLTLSQVSNRFFSVMGLIAFHLAFLAGTVWIYRRLRAPQIMTARKALGRATTAPWTGLVIGAVVLLATFYMSHRQLDEFDVLHARELAEAQYGKDLSYYVKGLRYQGGRIYADITAYGGDKLFSFQVYWTPKAPGE